jgi:peptidase M28-like protein
MTRRQKLVVALIMPVTLALAALLAAAFAQPIPPVAVSAAPSQFDAARALTDTLTLRNDYPDRLVGSEINTDARRWIIRRFIDLGLPVGTLPFTVTVASQDRAGMQVWATAPGESDEILLVSAHYDTPPKENPAFTDNAAGVAVLLELARIFSAEPHRRTLIFVASDSHAYGPAWGARNFAEQFERRDKIVAALELSYENPAADFIDLETTGLYRGGSPVWLRWAAPEVDRERWRDPGSASEFIRRALPFDTSDTAAYLRAGIPAIGFHASEGPLGAIPGVNPPPQFDPYLGQAAETWVRTVDALDPLPASFLSDFRLDGAHFLPGRAAGWLQLLLFVPLFLATAIVWRGHRPQDRPGWEELKPEFIAMMAIVIIGLDGYAVAYVLANLGWLPRYPLFPAAPGDPFLLRPAWWAALVIAGAMAFFGWYTFRRGGWGRYPDMLDNPHRRATLLIFFSGAVFFFWQINAYTVSALLGPAAYLWVWIEPRPTLRGKLLNTALALGGALPFAACVSVAVWQSPVGPWWWYLLLSAVYGFFPLVAVGGVIFFAALLLRLLRLGLRDE